MHIDAVQQQGLAQSHGSRAPPPKFQQASTSQLGLLDMKPTNDNSPILQAPEAPTLTKVAPERPIRPGKSFLQLLPALRNVLAPA